MATRTSLAGSPVPSVDLVELKDSNPRRLRSSELFDGRRVVLFALPGAFTPTCSSEHVPGYIRLMKDLQAAGIHEVVCLAVNDPYVMAAWQRSQNAHSLRFVSDPRGEFTQAMGMSVDHDEAGLGVRSWRYSMVVDHGNIEKMFIEPDVPGDPYGVSSAETMMRYLKPDYRPVQPAFMLARRDCPHCAHAKKLLDDSGISYEAVYIGDHLTMQGVKAASGAATVPQVFIDGQLIGGADKLQAYLASQKWVSRGRS